MMLVRLAKLLCPVGAVALTVAVHAAGTGADAALADLQAFLAAQPKWSVSASMDTSVGYNDNLLLSHGGEARSGFARGTLELLLLRMPLDAFDYSFFAQAEGSHYFSPAPVRYDPDLGSVVASRNHDSRAWVQSDIGYRVGDRLKFGLPVTGYYSDRVFDVSETELRRDVADVKVAGAMIGPNVRWTFRRGTWAELAAVGERKWYEDGANNGRVGEGAARLGWTPFDRLTVQLAAIRRWRDFDRRNQYYASGREHLGTDLKLEEREGELRFDITWDEAARWRTVTRATATQRRDNGENYFGYGESRVVQEVEWKSDAWLVRIEGGAKRTEFDVQLVGFGIDPPARLIEEFNVECRIERKLNARWTMFGGYTWERARSNDTIAAYVANEGLLGLRWSWEK